MNKSIAVELQEFTETIAERYSKTNRVGNVNNESCRSFFLLHK